MTPEFHRPLRWGLVGPAGRRERLEATAAECAALAARFGIPGIGALRAELRLAPDSDGAIRAEGSIEAEVTQACVVSLEPVRQRVAEAVALRFLPPGLAPDEDPESPDEIETDGEAMDLGEAVAEQLALALDPYPRHPEAALPPELAAEPEPPAKPNPFSALARLKPR